MIPRLTTTLAALLMSMAVTAQDTDNKETTGKETTGEPHEPTAVEPLIQRDAGKAPDIDTEDWEITLFGGTYKLDGFSAQPVAGARFGYHFNELIFIETAVGQAKVDDATVENLGRPSIFEQEKLDYYTLTLGSNIIDGQLFLGADRAFTSDLYLALGFGRVIVDDSGNTSIHFGSGVRALYNDWLTFRMDIRSHFIKESYLDPEEVSHNMEFAIGIGATF